MIKLVAVEVFGLNPIIADGKKGQK